MPVERTLAIVKPDAVQRRLIGRILGRFEDKGLRIVALKLIRLDRPVAERFYEMHRARPFFESLVSFMTSAPCLPFVVQGPSAISVVRHILGATQSATAAPGTIRGDFGLSTQTNLVHASDSPENAEREIGILFQPAELLDYEVASDSWVLANA